MRFSAETLCVFRGTDRINGEGSSRGPDEFLIRGSQRVSVWRIIIDRWEDQASWVVSKAPCSLRSAARMIPASSDDMLHIDDAQVDSDPMSGAGCDKQLRNMRLPILNLQSAFDKEYLQHRMHQRSKDADPVSTGLSYEKLSEYSVLNMVRGMYSLASYRPSSTGISSLSSHDLSREGMYLINDGRTRSREVHSSSGIRIPPEFPPAFGVDETPWSSSVGQVFEELAALSA